MKGKGPFNLLMGSDKVGISGLPLTACEGGTKSPS